VLADSVGLALYVVMDVLTPAERVSFVLHDVFEVPFDAIGPILGRSTAAAKMLASRARGRLRLGAPAAGAHAAAREVIDAFLAAAGQGDVAGLLTVLAPGAELRAHGRGGTVVIRGAGEIAAQAATFARPGALAHPALVDGIPGVLITIGGRPVTVLAFMVTDGRITAIRGLTAPSRLGQLVPSWVGQAPARGMPASRLRAGSSRRRSRSHRAAARWSCAAARPRASPHPRHARGAGWRWTFRHDRHALANASATWSSASCTLPVLATTAFRHGSQLAWKNSADSVFSRLTTP